MTAKEYLKKLKKLNTVIEQKMDELGELRVMSVSNGGIDYEKDRVKSSPKGEAPYVKTVEKMIELDGEINAEIDRYADEKHEIIKRIQQMDDGTEIEILYKRYVEFKSFERIAEEMRYALSSIFKIHDSALKHFSEKYAEILQIG